MIWEDVSHENDGAQGIARGSPIPIVISNPPAEDIYSNQPSTFSIEAPSSFENSPLIQLEELLEVSHPHGSTSPTLTIPTPMPSPVNTHAMCDSEFCPSHIDIDSSSVILSPFNTTNSIASSHTSARTLTPKITKKRQNRPKEWADVKRKCLKNLGKKYITKRGKAVDEKTMGPPCKCRYKC